MKRTDSKRPDFGISKLKALWEQYTDDELLPGATRHGLTVTQERERIRLMRTSPGEWPKSLQAFVKVNALQVFGHRYDMDVQEAALIEWLRQQPALTVVPVTQPQDVVVPAAA